MELLSNLALGFDVALQPHTFLYLLFGVTFGTFVGVLPGVGPLATIGVLLPITFHLPPVEAIVMLAGIYYGAMYGGSTTAILLNLPGTAASVIVALDGHPMAKQGKAGPALVLTTLVSFAGACVAILIIAAFAPPLAQFALRFGAAEYTTLMAMALLAAAVLVQGSLLKGMAMVILGLLLGMVGQDITTGVPRYTFGTMELWEGISFVVVIIGLFGLAEVIHNLGLKDKREAFTSKVPWRELIPSLTDLRRAAFPALRGSGVGAGLGILPGAGPALATFASYAVEKRISKKPEDFGNGAIEGMASAESANNSAAQTSFIPTLSLGVPGDATMALMLGAMMIHGLVPGPAMLENHPEFFWGLIASFWIGNLLLVILNLPLIGVWIRLLAMPYRWLFPAIIMFIAIGMYSLHNSAFDVFLAAGFGVLGYIFIKLRCEAAPLLLGLILGPLIEENMRRALQLSRGDYSIFVTRPISLTFIVLGLALFAVVVYPIIRDALQGKSSVRTAPEHYSE